jgi:hypothetical protein
MYCYKNNGNIESVEDGYEPQDGEVLSLDLLSAEDLATASPACADAQAAMARGEANAVIQRQMDSLDGGGQARAVRLALLAITPAGDEHDRLQAVEDKVAALRAQLVA